jgi:uncharacterized protein (TIGR02246 family)
MRKAILIFCCLAWASLASAAPSPDQRAVEAVIADSAKGWNAGDVERFMASYSDRPDTSFVTEKGLVRGKAAMLARYKAKYDFADPAKRGVLTFEPVDYRQLDPVHALYIGRWILTYPDGKTVQGHTSLLMAHEKGGWRIIADHSS